MKYSSIIHNKVLWLFIHDFFPWRFPGYGQSHSLYTLWLYFRGIVNVEKIYYDFFSCDFFSGDFFSCDFFTYLSCDFLSCDLFFLWLFFRLPKYHTHNFETPWNIVIKCFIYFIWLNIVKRTRRFCYCGSKW